MPAASNGPLRPSALLWVDCTAGIFAGVLVLAGSSWLSEFYALPRPLLAATGAANVAYGLFSFSLARRAARPRSLIVLLVVANALWAVFCVIVAAHFAATASLFGLAHLIGEAIVVGGLAVLEWRHREHLTGRT